MTNREEQFEYCQEAVNGLEQKGIPLTHVAVLRAISTDEVVAPTEWQATVGRLVAMIRQVGLHGELTPSYGVFSTDEFFVRTPRVDRRKSHSNMAWRV